MQDGNENTAQQLDSENVAELSVTTDSSSSLPVQVISETVTFDQEEFTCCQPTKHMGSSLNITRCNASDENSRSEELLSADEEMSGACMSEAMQEHEKPSQARRSVSACTSEAMQENENPSQSRRSVSACTSEAMQEHENPSQSRRSVAVQTDAYDSDDDDDDTSCTDVASDSDSSSLCSSDYSGHSNVLSQVTADHCDDDVDQGTEENVEIAQRQPVADYSNTCDMSLSAVPEQQTDEISSCVEILGLSDRLGDNSSSTSGADTTDSSTNQMPLSVNLLASEQKSQENCSSGSGLEAAVMEEDVTCDVIETALPCVNSERCDRDDPCSVTDTHVRCHSVGSDASPAKQTVASDADEMMRMPACSPGDVSQLTADVYQSSCAAYSSPSDYGGSPPSCVQQTQNGSLNSVGGVAGYSMLTPSPTNSSARSFNMASPSSYQQLASVTQLEQSCTVSCQLEPNKYQPPTSSILTSMTSYQQPAVENYPQSLPPRHQTVTPPIERVSNNYPSVVGIDYVGGPVQHSLGYQLVGRSPSCMPQMMGSWSSLYMQQEDQQNAIKSVAFDAQCASRGHMMAQNIGQTSPQSSSLVKQRQYGGKNCNKNTISHGRLRTNRNAAPNVAIQPATNKIATYDIYNSGITECSGNAHAGEMNRGFDYHSLRHPTALGCPGGFVSHHPHAAVPSNIYQYQQQAAGSYAASAQSNYIHSQTICPSTLAYGYVNRTMIGDPAFDMNAMRH